MKFYLSGPMTGLPQFNYPLFAEVSTKLRAAGLTVFSPHEALGGHGDRTREEYMREDLKQLLECDAIILLPDWEKAAGAILEVDIADQCGLDVYVYRDTDEFIVALKRVEKLFHAPLIESKT